MRALLIVLFSLLTWTGAGAQSPGATGPWDERTLERWSRVAVQEGGRIKPFSTATGFLLLRLRGMRSIKVPEQGGFGELAGTTIDPVAWGLDCLFRPRLAWQYPVFLIEDKVVLDAIGLADAARKKRDRYTYEDLRPGLRQLFQMHDQFVSLEANQRTRVQQQVVELASRVYEFELFSASFQFARMRVPLDDNLRTLLPDHEEMRFSNAIAEGPKLHLTARQLFSQGVQGDEKAASFRDLMMEVDRVSRGGTLIAMLPPADRGAEQWLSPRSMAQQHLIDFGAAPAPQDLALLRAIEEGTDRLQDGGALGIAETLIAAARVRGEYGLIEREVAFYEVDYFYKAQIGFILCFLVAAFTWLRPPSRRLPLLPTLLMVAPTGYLVWGVVERCILRDRPPVSTLYETVLFVTGVVVLVALGIELINRKKIAVSLGALLGAGGMFLAAAHESFEGTDTMPTLQAVLDTNFWLATHVTAVTIGYAATLFAGFIAHVYLLGKTFGLRKDANAFYQNIGKMVYGVLCFGLVFAIVGTILGGIWANDSWGRFWGWDPKENGALLICLWSLLILHARLGGFVRNFGICALAVFGNTVVAFSWWGVNQLGVGLHSYGEIDGVSLILWIFYAVEWGVIATALLARKLQSLGNVTAA